MKNISIVFSGLFCLLLLAGCEKNTFKTSTYKDVSDQAFLKVVFLSPYRSNPSYQIKINDTRVSNVITRYDTPFPGGGLNTGGGSTADYTTITPGAAKISISLPKSGTNTDSIQLATANLTLDAGKKYSLYFADTAASTTTLLVLDTLARPDSGFAKYKFINLIPDLPAADLYIGTTKVASNIPYKGISSSFTVPTNSSNATWAIRAAGGTANLITYPGSVSATIGNQRVYTVVARGYRSISATSDVRRGQVSLIYNQ